MVVALATLVACAALIWAGHGLILAFNRIDHGRTVITRADTLLIAMIDVETGQRGYLLTGNDEYLAPYRRAIGQVFSDLEELEHLVADNPEQGARLVQMRQQVVYKLNEIDTTLSLWRDGAREEALTIVQSDRGRQAMDVVRAHIASFLEREEILLDQRNRAAFQYFLWTAIPSLTLALLCGVMGFFYVRSLLQHQREQQVLWDALVIANRDLENRVAERTRELSEANDVKSRFLANMSHELRTPLNAVIGYAQMIAQERLGPIGEPRYRDYAAQVEASGQHLLDMINDILDFSKMEAGQFRLHAEAIDPLEIAETCLRMMRPQAEKGEVALLLKQDAAPLEINADPVRLRQILLNLLSNAVKFTPPGKQVSLSLQTAPGRQIVFEIADQGIGMSAAEIAQAMQPFVQIDNAAMRRSQGTGLGLPLTKALAELHGGSLTLCSVPGQGTVARVEL